MSTQVSARRRPPARRPSPGVALPRPWVVPLAIVGVALLVRVIAVIQLGGHPLLQPRGDLDDAVYVRLAHRIAAGDLALGPDVYYVSPLYAYFLGAIFAITGGSLGAARVVQAALGAVAVGLILQTATMWFGRRSGVIAGALAAASGIFVFNEVLVLQSALDPFLAALSLFLLTRALQKGQKGQVGQVGKSAAAPALPATPASPALFLAAGASLGALSLNRPNALPVVGGIAAAWFLACRSRQALIECVALVLGVVLLVAPVAVRNRVVGGEWVLVTSHGGLNFYIGNTEKADGTYISVSGIRPSIEGQKEDVLKVASAALNHPATASEASSYFYDRAWQWIASHPIAWAQLVARKTLLTFHSADLALNFSYLYFALDEPTIVSVLVVGPWLIIPFGLLGLIVCAPRKQLSAYLSWAAFVPIYALTLIAFFVSSRYRLALLVPLLTTAGAGVGWLWERLSARDAKRLMPAALVLVLMFVVFNWPIVALDGRMFEREERIVRDVADGQIDEAKRLLEATEPLHANRATMLYRVGLAFRDRNDPTNAAIYLERAQRWNPREPWIDFNLGEALLQAKRPADALPHLERARAAGINPATVAYDIAGCYAELGQRDRARAELDAMPITDAMAAENLVELGSAAMQMEDAALAEKFLREAVRRSPQIAAAHEHLGVVLGMQGKSSDALPEFEAAVRLNPQSAVSQLHLAVACAELGRLADARTAAERALQIDPNYAPARSLLARLGR